MQKNTYADGCVRVGYVPQFFENVGLHHSLGRRRTLERHVFAA